MMTVRGPDDEIVKGLEVSIISGQDGSTVTDGMGQVNLVTASAQPDISGDLDIVAVSAQQSEQSGIEAVVVDIQPHRPSLTRSSVERGRGLPENL